MSSFLPKRDRPRHLLSAPLGQRSTSYHLCRQASRRENKREQSYDIDMLFPGLCASASIMRRNGIYEITLEVESCLERGQEQGVDMIAERMPNKKVAIFLG